MILFFVWIQNVECLAIPAELQKDRYVVREHKSFKMDCNHKLDTVTRVRWQYISTHNNNNRRETIYDSQQPNNTLKSGFEVFCQPHEVFISTCILKLVQTRKNDSGKYICYIGQGNETMFYSNMLKPITEIELVIRGPIYKTVIANNGDSVILPCEHNIKNVTRTRWNHVSIHGVLTFAVYHMPAKETSNKNYEALCEPHELSCNLKILQANKESAGKYICKVGESLEFEEKYGLDQMTHFIEIELVVGELECNENMNKDLTLIGENDCYGIEADVLNLKCSFNYFGNINYNLLHLRWIEKYKFNSLEKKLNSSLINHETNKISIQTNLSVVYEMQNSVFQCVLDDTKVKPCHLNEFRTQYIKNTTERSPPIHYNDLLNMKCLANKSANVQCSYYWVHEVAGAMIETPHVILPVEHMNSPGVYTCIAKCQLGNNKECIIKAMDIEVVQGLQLRGIMIGLIIGSILAAAITTNVFLVLKKFKNKTFFKRLFKHKEEDNKNGLPEQNILLKKDEVQQETKEFLRDQTLQDTGDEVAGDEIEIIRLSPAPLNPLESKKILHEKKTVYHEIKIYEARDTDYGKVMMIDGAVWDIELDEFSYQKLINVLPIESHPNPRKVLVIGGGEVRTVNELVKNPEVESITVCEVDEELLAMFRNYVPTLISSLDDPKVKIHIGDGFEFLKNTRDAFDVIINHSSGFQGPSGYLFTKEYYEVVKSKLNERGVMSSIVNREDVSGSDVIESRVMNFCKELFPVFQYLYIPVFNHPSSLVRCLICSLNPATNFTRLFGKLNLEYGLGRIKRKLWDEVKKFKKMMAKEMSFFNLGEQLKQDGEQRKEKNDADKKRRLREKINPSSNEFLKDIASGQTIADHKNERNFPNISKPRKIFSAKGKGYNLLNEKYILHNKRSEHRVIKIYESTNNGKVFMLDGAIWMTELDSRNLKALTSTLLISHEEPKNILVIGGGDGAIVRKLLKHPKVESITVYEADEEIIKLGHKYFHSLTSSLDDPKVKVQIGDEKKFLKKQKNDFDVIFIRSTSVQGDYIDKKYFVAIENALKKKGVVCLIVDGKGAQDDDDDHDNDDDDHDLMPIVMLLCEHIFPVVQYFRIPFQEHPGTLTRCIMCSFNSKTDFYSIFEVINEEIEEQKWLF